MEIDKESTKEEILEKFEQLKEAFKTLKGNINEPKYYYQQDSLSAYSFIISLPISSVSFRWDDQT